MTLTLLDCRQCRRFYLNLTFGTNGVQWHGEDIEAGARPTATTRQRRQAAQVSYKESDAYWDDVIENIDNPAYTPAPQDGGKMPVGPNDPSSEFEHAAEASRMETNAMSETEQRRFPQYSNPPLLQQYLRARNRIVSWVQYRDAVWRCNIEIEQKDNR